MTFKPQEKQLPPRLRRLLTVAVGLMTALVYIAICVIAYPAVRGGDYGSLIPAVLLLPVFVGLCWVLGRLIVGFKKIMMAAVVVTFLWLLAYAWLPKLFKYLVKFLPVKKKKKLSNLTVTTRVVCFMLAIAWVGLYLASRKGAVKKAAQLIPLGLLVVYFGCYCLAACGLPKGLHSVTASNFVNWWSGRAMVVELVMLLTLGVYTSVYSRIQNRRAREEAFSDSDLMLMQNFDRHTMAGYYLLKGKLKGVFEFSVKEGNAHVQMVKLAPISREERQALCEDAPYMSKLVARLEEEGEDGTMEVRCLIKEVTILPPFRKEGGLRAEKTLQHITLVSGIATLVCGVLVWLPGFIRHLNSVYLEKTVQDLPVHVCLATPVFFLIFWVLTTVFAHVLWDLHFKKPILKALLAGDPSLQTLIREADAHRSPLSEEEIVLLLRTYALRGPGLDVRKKANQESTQETETTLLVSEIQQVSVETPPDDL